jgi:hypothetical protein
LTIPSTFFETHFQLTEPIQNRPDGGALNKIEEPEDDPVSQPLLVVGLSRALESLDTEISGKNPTNQVGQGAGQSEEVEEDQENGGSSKTENTVNFGNTSLSLDVVEDGVLTELSGSRWKISFQPG